MLIQRPGVFTQPYRRIVSTFTFLEQHDKNAYQNTLHCPTELQFYVPCSVGVTLGLSLQEMKADGRVSKQGVRDNTWMLEAGTDKRIGEDCMMRN